MRLRDNLLFKEAAQLSSDPARKGIPIRTHTHEESTHTHTRTGEVVLYDWVEWLKEEHSYLYLVPQQQREAEANAGGQQDEVRVEERQ